MTKVAKILYSDKKNKMGYNILYKNANFASDITYESYGF